MTLLSKNLNTVPVLHALLLEESVAGAARRVGLSQPTVSGILARLRTDLGDPLLVRSGRGMRLTPRARRLMPAVAELCRGLEQLYEPEELDPAALDRRFVIAAPDHLAFLLTPGLVEQLAREAPRVRLRFVDVDPDLDAHIADDLVDLAVCGNFGLWPGLRYQPLFPERIVAAMWREHPLARRRRVTTEQIRRYPSSAMDSGFASSGRRSRIRTGVPSLDMEPRVTLGQFTDAVLLTVGTDFVAPAPEALVRRLGETLPVVGVHLAEADSVDSGLFWAPARDHDGELVWLRSVVERTARRVLT